MKGRAPQYYCTTQYYFALHSITLYYTILLCTTQYYYVLHNITVYYTVLLCTILYYLGEARNFFSKNDGLGPTQWF